MPGMYAEGDVQPLDLTPIESPVPSIEQLLAFASAHSDLSPLGTARRVRRELGISELRYVQLLNRAIDDPRAAALAPDLVDRLLERRTALRARRSRTSGGERA